MIKYSEFQPTAFDSKGLLGEYHGISDFLVVPVTQTRDSGPLDRSNFEQALEMLGGESDDVQVHRFGHWGPGWFEIILVDPKSDKVRIAEDIESSLADYPVLNEEDFSEKETKETEEYYQFMSLSERVDVLHETGESIFAARAESAYDFYHRAPNAYYRIQDRAISNY